MADTTGSPSRRRFFKGLSLIPVVAVSLPGCSPNTDTEARAPDAPAGAPGSMGNTQTANATGEAYRPTFFNADEWRFVHAVCERLIPADEHGPSAIEAGVPEFLDRHMQTPYAAGDIWYMQGPFLEASSDFGYQGRLPLRDILRVGMRAFDTHARNTFGGKTFAELEPAQQEGMLRDADGNKLKLDDISAKVFFNNLLAETRNGYFADPSHGGNRDMGPWKMIGYPGMRGDYLDWVEVRDRPYSLPAVDLSGRRA